MVTKKKTRKPFLLPESDCERLNRTEMQAIRWCFACMSSVAYAKDDLAKRLECIPYGRQRWRLMMGALKSLLDDIVGTVPPKQCLTIKNTATDMDMRLVPKMTPMANKCVVTVNDLHYIVQHAKKDVCMACIKDDAECRTCEMYRILEAIAPLEDYGGGSICPYMKEDWVDR